MDEATEAVVAKVYSVMQRCLEEYQLPHGEARYVKCSEIPFALLFEGGGWYVAQEKHYQWYGIRGGYYSSTIMVYVRAANKLGLLTEVEVAVFKEWLRCQDLIDREKSQTDELLKLADRLGYDVSKRPEGEFGRKA